MNIEDLENEIHLSKNERKLFEMMRMASKTYQQKVKIYAVGGWVRDHLLGIPSTDLDIMVNGISNEELAYTLEKMDPTFIVNVFHASICSRRLDNFQLIKIILKDGTEIDLANNYSIECENVIAGDALRRDLTINAIFYNIIDKRVEDYVGGLYDLKNRIARSPRSPDIVFHNDQIQVVRALRFASHLNLNFADGMLEGLSSASVTVSGTLTPNISQKEVQKAFNNNNPQRFINLLISTSMFKIVFGDFKWDFLDIKNRVNQVCQRVKNNQRYRILLATIINSLSQSNKSISGKKKKAIGFNTNANKISSAANELSTFLRGFTKLDVAIWIKRYKNEWNDSIYILENENDYQLASTKLIQFIKEEDLENLACKKPLLNGNECLNLVGKNHGSWMKNFQKIMFQWSIENPNGDKNDFIEFFNNNKMNEII
ncbi:hypothetical protein TRFO_17646 [Tritrichomonas foetus]|uniref:Poly A polymerase head domain-containing protein n=1 Tax=Tritrichomonas foetus TaxID=1144522 RepID=A0A1J4KNK1_9EUKA|nr:hypothetical protein TRFO_17646 [Tritrichomonas foetus]|eukprot:OHT12488.1 hypothetical protein TRFO_17646 [Tritrichomonas foetus]